MEYSNGTAEAYRYHGGYGPESAAFGGPTAAANAFCGSNVPLAADTFHLSAHAPPPMVSRRYHPYGEHPHANGHSGHPGAELSSTFGGYGPSHQCEQCGAVYDSPHSLAEHVQNHHFAVYGDNYPAAPGPGTHHCHPQQQAPPPPQGPPALQPLKSESETAEILDLDSHKVHVYQPPGTAGVNVNGPAGLAPTPPYTPATSVGSASNSSSMGWMTPTPPLPPSLVAPPQQQPPSHDYRQQLPQHPAAAANGTNGGHPFPGYELMSPVSQNNVVNNNGPPPTMKSSWKANNPPAANHGGGSEARRPKTYNCEACNKWFTSSGHLKRHYNTTLHKNAVKATNGTNSSGENGRRSATPSNRSTPGAVGSPTGSDEPKMDEMMMNAQPSPKPIASPGEYRPQMQHVQQPAPVQSGPVPQSAYPQSAYGMAPMQQIAPPQQSPMDQYRVPFNMAPNGAPPGPYYCPPPGPGVGRPGGPGPGPGPGYPAVSGYPPMQPQQHMVQQQQQQHPHVYPQQNSMGYPPNPSAPPLSSNGPIAAGVGPIASRPMQHSAHQLVPNSMQTVFNNNNMERSLKDDELIKMDVMNGGDVSSPSEGSPDGSDLVDGSDASDAESVETKRIKNATPKRGPNAGGGSDGVGSFKCQQCDKAFNRVCYLTQHNNTFHKGDKPFKCHMCGKRFQNAELFAQHQQKHAGDKPYKCPLCPKQFNHKTDLRRHMCLHTGQKPFMCQVCSKGFIRKDHMVKHVQTHTRRNALHASNAPPTAPSL